MIFFFPIEVRSSNLNFFFFFFLQVVVLERTLKYLNVISHLCGWVITGIIVIAINAMQLFGVDFNAVCGILDINYRNGFYFIPSAVILFSASLLNIFIAGKVMYVSGLFHS